MPIELSPVLCILYKRKHMKPNCHCSKDREQIIVPLKSLLTVVAK